MKSNIKDIVTVVWLGDLNQVRMQSHSIDLFITDPITHWVIVQDRSDCDLWTKELSKFYTRHKLKVIPTLLPDNEYDRPDRDGYRNQMLLKLMGSNLISNERYLVLDSKNFFIKQQSLNNWPTLDGRPIIRESCYETIWRKNWLDAVSGYLELDRTEYTYEILTPFVMTTDISKKCCEYDLSFLFNEMSVLFGYWESEFMFYSLIAKNFFNKLDKESLIGQPAFEKADTCEITLNDFTKETLEEIYTRPGNLTFLHHRDVIKSMTDQQKLTFLEWTTEKGFDRDIVKDPMEKYI